jgi:hypothetical protein
MMTVDEYLAEMNLDELPPPPPVLYKYVAPDRIDVLERSRIRFTPLLGTNDLFEVRQTFRQFAGPKFRAMIMRGATKIDFDAQIVDMIQTELGLDAETAARIAPEVILRTFGPNHREAITNLVAEVVDAHTLPFFNTPKKIENWLEGMGSRLLALSLSDDPYNPVMWAHYGANWRGIVIAFDTSNRFFTQGRDGTPKCLNKVAYFDEQYDELFDSPRTAMSSKKADWKYEREWRLYITEGEADEVLIFGEHTVHLRSFPSDAVSRVIVGHEAAEADIARLREVMSRLYPEATLTGIVPKRFSAQLAEERL